MFNKDSRNNRVKKKLSFNDPEISNWSQKEASLSNMLQKIEDEELRSVLVNRISLVKFIYEMNWIDRMKATVENFFKIENNDDNQKNGFYKDAEKVISENPRNSNKP